MVYARLLWIFLCFAVGSNFILWAEWKSTPKIVPKEYPIIIWCINQITWEIRKPLNQTFAGCYHWSKGWKNLRFPSKEQLRLMKEVYKTRAWVVTAMTLMNHESQFNPKAKGCSKNWCDIWLFQIREVNWGAKMNDKQQMEWFAKRKEWQLSPKWNCYHRVKEWNHEKILKCVFARHNWVLVWTAPYPTKRYEEWKFYNSIQF